MVDHEKETQGGVGVHRTTGAHPIERSIGRREDGLVQEINRSSAHAAATSRGFVWMHSNHGD